MLGKEIVNRQVFSCWRKVVINGAEVTFCRPNLYWYVKFSQTQCNKIGVLSYFLVCFRMLLSPTRVLDNILLHNRHLVVAEMKSPRNLKINKNIKTCSENKRTLYMHLFFQDKDCYEKFHQTDK